MKIFQRINKGVKSAAVYTLATIFSRGLAIVTVPIFTRLMSTEQMGIVNVYNSCYSLLSVITTLSLTSGGFSVAMKDYSDKRDEYMSSVLSLTSLIAVLFSIIYFISPVFWNDVFGLTTPLVILMLMGFFFAPARDFWLARQRYEYKYKLSGIVMFLSAIAASLLSVGVVCYYSIHDLQNAAEGRLIANYSVVYIVAAIIWLSIMLKGRTFYNKTFWKGALQLSLPLLGYSISAQILNVSDRIMISKMIGNSEVGIYGTLYTVSSIALMVWNAINASFVPYLFENIEKENEARRIRKISTELLIVYSCVAVFLTFFSPEIVRILGTDEYYEAIYIMPPIAAGIFYIAVANIYSNIAVYYKSTKYVMYPSIIAAILNVALNLVFIPLYGYMAAAYTTLFSYIIMAAVQILLIHHLLKKKGLKRDIYNNKEIVALCLITTALSLIGLVLYHYTVLRYIAVIISLCFGTFFARMFLKSRKSKTCNG